MALRPSLQGMEGEARMPFQGAYDQRDLEVMREALRLAISRIGPEAEPMRDKLAAHIVTRHKAGTITAAALADAAVKFYHMACGR